VLLLTRQQCCLCEQMKAVVREVQGEMDFELEELDIDSDPKLRARYHDQIPVLFINGRKAFKYRVSREGLKRKLLRSVRHGACGGDPAD